MSSKYQRLLVFWGVIFVLSLLFMATNWRVFRSGDTADPPAIPTDGPDSGEGTDDGDGEVPPVIDIPDETERAINLLLSVATAVVSASGFIVTTIYAKREDQRETEMHSLEVAKLRKEIEQKELEIERLRKQ